MINFLEEKSIVLDSTIRFYAVFSLNYCSGETFVELLRNALHNTDENVSRLASKLLEKKGSLIMEQTAEELTIEKLVALPFQQGFKLSNDGDYIYYYSNKSGKNEIYQFSFKTGKSELLTNGNASKTPRNPLRISKNDKLMFFEKDPIEGNERYNIWKFDIEKKKATQVTDTPKHADVLHDTTKDSEKLLFGSDRDKNINQIFIMDNDGSNIEQLTHHKDHVNIWNEIFFSNDEKSVFYATNDTAISKNLDIWKYSFESKFSEKILSLSIGSKESPLEISSNDEFLVFDSDFSGYNRVGLLNLKTKEIIWFGEKNVDEYFGSLNEKTQEIIVRRVDGANTMVISYNIKDHTEKELSLPDGVYGVDKKVKDGRFIILNHNDSIHTSRILLYDLETGSYTEKIPSAVGNFKPERDFYPANYISYKSTDDVEIHALMYKPKVKTEKKYPAIIMPHGGPTSRYTNSFIEKCQLLVSNGFVLLLPNVRGSTGYGNDFRDACLIDWGGKDLQDIEYGVKFLQSLPYVDKNNIGITGGSYGGYLTYISMGKIPNYFKAGSAVVGISSLRLLYEGNKKTFPMLSRYFEEQMGKPETEEIKNLWEDRSGVNFIHQMTGKLQIIHTINDPRCPLDQAEVVKEKLLGLGKIEGKDFEYVIYDDAGHGSDEIEFRKKYYQSQLDFFNKYLKAS